MDDERKVKIDKDKIINNTITATLVVVLSFIIIYSLVIVFTPIIKGQNSDNTDAIKRINEAINKISNEYIDNVDIETLVEGAISGVARATGDPYTRYLTEDEYQEMLTSGTEVYGGIGVRISYDEKSKGIIVLGVMPSSPALDSGIKAGDIITGVGDTAVTYENYNECVDNMKGEEGTKIKITISRDGNIIQKEVERKKINNNNVESKIVDGNIGYIKIWSFENNIYNQFKAEYEILMAKNVKGLIIDLRNNPGGIVSETLDIARLLLPKGNLLKLVYKTGKEKIYKDNDDSEINIPLAVLVNSQSASASEILSAAIKDSKKGAIIGNKTYGKGIVQSIEKLDGKGALSITTSKYYTISGIEIHKNGIEPDIQIDLPEEYKNDAVISEGHDTQLREAINYINQK